MPQIDRYRERIVPIEFEYNEDFSTFPLDNRVSLILITNGSVSLMLNDKAITVNAPCVILLSCYDKISVMDKTRLSAKSFSFEPCFMNSALTFGKLKDNNYTELCDEHDSNMLAMFLERDNVQYGVLNLPPQVFLRLEEWVSIMGTETFTQSDEYWTCRIRRYLLQSLYLINDIYIDKNNLEFTTKSPVDIVLESIHINYANELSLDNFCSLVNINRTTLNRKFKAKFGKTIMDYLILYRIKIACDALTHTNLSLTEIGESTGFKYDTYFIKQFTKKMSMSPTEYRRKAWGNKSE